MGEGAGEREGTSSNKTSASTSIETYQKHKNSRNTILSFILCSLYDDLIGIEFLKRSAAATDRRRRVACGACIHRRARQLAGEQRARWSRGIFSCRPQGESCRGFPKCCGDLTCYWQNGYSARTVPVVNQSMFNGLFFLQQFAGLVQYRKIITLDINITHSQIQYITS